MPQPPIAGMMDVFLLKLTEDTKLYKKHLKSAENHANAIRALAQLCENQEVREEYLTRLEEAAGKQGFVDAIRSILGDGKPRSPIQIKNVIVALKKMDLTGYSNPMASIHTTLRRMKKSGEAQEVANLKGEKTYQIIKKG